MEKLRQNLVTCIKGISLLVPIFIKLIKWINNNIVKIKEGGGGGEYWIVCMGGQEMEEVPAIQLLCC